MSCRGCLLETACVFSDEAEREDCVCFDCYQNPTCRTPCETYWTDRHRREGILAHNLKLKEIEYYDIP